MQGPVPTQSSPQRFFHMPRFQHTYQKNFNVYQYKQHMQQNQNVEFDGKRLRKAVNRKTIDYNSSVIKYLETRVWRRDFRDQRAIQPDNSYYTELFPCMGFADNPINAVTTKFVRTSTSKMRCPIFCLCWTPEGRRLVTGASSGEFTLWNGLTFNFETILQAHDSPVRSMIWSHNDTWMITGDHAGFVKYWQSNMNNVKMFQAHQEPLRGLSFCPTDTKFATCSDDGTIRIWDFLRCHEEKILRGHGADVKCVDWHPQKSLLVSGSKDSQQPIKLWDPKSGLSLATLHAHKSTVMEIRWNQNGNWLLTASRDHLLKLFDIRNMKELQTFRGHKKEATSIAWHPVHESLFASGGSDGAIMFWLVGADKEVGGMEQAHESIVWSLAWHPLGHILCSGSNDHTSKFWTRNRPGDRMRDKYNLNTLPVGSSEDMLEYDDISTAPTIPGMGLEYGLPEQLRSILSHNDDQFEGAIPGLDWDDELDDKNKLKPQKKVPYSKPIPHQFQQQWAENKQPLLLAPPKGDGSAAPPQQPPPLQQPPPQGMHPTPNLNMPPPNMPPPNMPHPNIPHPPFMTRPRMPSPIHQDQGMGGPRGPRPMHSNMTFRPPRPNMNQMPRNMRPMNPGHMGGAQNPRMPSPGDGGHFRDEGMSTSPPNINRSNDEPSQNFHQSNSRNMFRNTFEEQPQKDFSNPFGDSDLRNRNLPPPQDNQPPDHRQIRGPPPRWEDSQRPIADYDERLSTSNNDNYFEFDEQENQKFGKEFRGRGRGSPRGRGRGRDFSENNERFSRQGLDEQEMPSSENINSIKRTWEEGPGNRGTPQSFEEEQDDSRGSAQRQWGENSNEQNNQRGQFRQNDDSYSGSHDWNENNYGHRENKEDSNHSTSHRGSTSDFRGAHHSFGKQNTNTSHGGPGNSPRNQGFNEDFSEQNSRKGSSNRGRGEGRGGWAPRRGRSRGRGGRGSRGQ